MSVQQIPTGGPVGPYSYLWVTGSVANTAAFSVVSMKEGIYELTTIDGDVSLSFYQSGSAVLSGVESASGSVITFSLGSNIDTVWVLTKTASVTTVELERVGTSYGLTAPAVEVFSVSGSLGYAGTGQAAVVGGGGGGSAGKSNLYVNGASGGGGSGGVTLTPVLTFSGNENFTIGAGGAAGIANNSTGNTNTPGNVGGSGGTTTFDTNYIATGGSGGVTDAGGAGGSPDGGAGGTPGQSSGVAEPYGVTTGGGGGPGASQPGGGSGIGTGGTSGVILGNNLGNVGLPGTGYGAGGGGGSHNDNAIWGRSGGAGTGGCIYLWKYE